MNKNNELSSILDRNPVPLLKHFAITDSGALKEQILLAQDGKETFFISMIGIYRVENTQRDILKLCIEYGYDIKIATEPISYFWQSSKMKINKCSDYLLAWEIVSDKLLSELTTLCGKDYLLSLEDQGVPLLEKAYSRKKFETIKVLDRMGVGKRPEYNNEDKLLKIAESDEATLKFYWGNKNPSSEDAFKSMRFFIGKKISVITTSDGVSDKHNVEDLKNLLKNELPKFNKEQQEQIIADTVTCINSKIYTYALSVIKITPVSYMPKTSPAWINLDKAKSYHFLHHFIDKKTPLDSYSPDGQTSYLSNLCKHLEALNYSGVKSYGSRNERKKTQSISDKLEKLMLGDFWLSKDPKTHHPWFHTACTNNKILKKFANNWLAISCDKLNVYKDDKEVYPAVIFSNPIENKENLIWNKSNSMSHDNKKIMKEVLQKTWLYKDENSITCIEHAIKNYPYLIESNDVLDKKLSDFLVFEETSKLFPYELKTLIFKNLFSHESFKSHTFNILFDNLKTDNEMWKNFTIDKNMENKLERDYPNLLIQLRHLTYEHLLKDDKDVIKKNKL